MIFAVLLQILAVLLGAVGVLILFGVGWALLALAAGSGVAGWFLEQGAKARGAVATVEGG